MSLFTSYRKGQTSAKDSKVVNEWSYTAAALQDCFEHIDWQVFRDAATTENQMNMEEYISMVMAYLSKCAEDVVTTKIIISFPNQNSWITGEVRALVRDKNAAFRSAIRLRIMLPDKGLR